MSRGVFRSHNKVGETMSFQTNSDNGTTFDPTVSFLSGSAVDDTVSWDLGEGSGYTAGNSISYTYPDATTKTVTLRTSKLSNLGSFNSQSDNIVGNLDMSGWSNLRSSFRVNNNLSLTGITHTTSTQSITNYRAYQCDLTGNLNLPFSNLGGIVDISSNPNLTGITHSASTQIFSFYKVDSCGIINLDLSMLSNLGGTFSTNQCNSLEKITHTKSTQTFSFYGAQINNLIGNHDLSMFPNLGGFFTIDSNSSLTGITHTASTQTFTKYGIHSCNLIGTLDLSMLSGLGGNFSCSFNSNLNNVIFPNTTGTFKNASNNIFNRAFSIDACNFLGSLNFWALSGITMDVNSTYGAEIRLQNNNMSQSDVDNYLLDFSGITTNNINRWSGVTLDISGTNAAPSTTGLAAVNYLTGATAQWTVTTN